MKPIREYLQELPTPYNALALSVVDENYNFYQAEVVSLHEAISRMCNWEQAPQGHDFWYAVSNWCINPNKHQLPPIPAVEVSPEVEQPKTPLEKVLGSALNEVKGMQKHICELEQENTELKADNNALKLETLRANASESDLLNKVADLESQITALAGLADFEQEPLSNPKELVCDAEWLANVVNNYDDIYWLSGETVSVGGITLSPKDSAPIIFAALSKKLNVNSDNLEDYEILAFQNGEISVTRCTKQSAYFGEVKFAWNTAQKAIDILTQIAPQILKNYFA
jgi:hypothetical protein